MSQRLESKPVIEKIKQSLIDKTQELKSQGIVPMMKVILVGEHPPSVIYTRNKKRFCESVGAECEIIKIDESIEPEDFKNVLKDVAADTKTHGMFVQLPLPNHLQHVSISKFIPPGKDVDGFHPENTFKLMMNSKRSMLVPCTPKGVVTLLNHYEIPIKGKKVAIIGRSMIVGKPLSMLLTNNDATVTLCHSKTENLKEITKNVDIIITALGVAKFLTSDFINDSKKQVVIDVGINHDENGKLCGDADFECISPLVHAITPVPGGVGPMTILSLVQNLLQAASNK